jgi:hypothetical protein
MVGEAERVIARRSRDDSAPLFRGRQEEEGVAGAALLERAGALEVVEFAVDPAAGDFPEGNRFRTRCENDAARNPSGGGTNVP